MTGEQLLAAAQHHIDEAARRPATIPENDSEAGSEASALIAALHQLLRVRVSNEKRLEALATSTELRHAAMEAAVERLSSQIDVVASRLARLEASTSLMTDIDAGISVRTLADATKVLNQIVEGTRKKRSG